MTLSLKPVFSCFLWTLYLMGLVPSNSNSNFTRTIDERRISLLFWIRCTWRSRKQPVGSLLSWNIDSVANSKFTIYVSKCDIYLGSKICTSQSCSPDEKCSISLGVWVTTVFCCLYSYACICTNNDTKTQDLSPTSSLLCNPSCDPTKQKWGSDQPSKPRS